MRNLYCRSYSLVIGQIKLDGISKFWSFPKYVVYIIPASREQADRSHYHKTHPPKGRHLAGFKILPSWSLLPAVLLAFLVNSPITVLCSLFAAHSVYRRCCPVLKRSTRRWVGIILPNIFLGCVLSNDFVVSLSSSTPPTPILSCLGQQRCCHFQKYSKEATLSWRPLSTKACD